MGGGDESVENRMTCAQSFGQCDDFFYFIKIQASYDGIGEHSKVGFCGGLNVTAGFFKHFFWGFHEGAVGV